ncbi:hypothetical protein [Amycolatopsis sp. NPDC051071]|uniref:hypothetical protein n=1 Tax=Amycolatopsis sp. NPDC051071 TaxID=3154637 RepID=UPI003427EE99
MKTRLFGTTLAAATLDRVERVYREGMDGHVAFENQLARWQRDHPDAAGLAEFVEQIGTHHRVSRTANS